MDRTLIRRLLVGTAMAGMVVVGARGGSVFASLRLGRPTPEALLYVLVAAVLLGITGAWGVAVMLGRRHGGPHPAGQRSWGVSPRRLFPGAVVAVALVGLLGISRLNLAIRTPTTAEAAPPHQGTIEGRPLGYRDDRTSALHAGDRGNKGYKEPAAADRPMQVGTALLVLLASAILVWWWIGRRSRARARALAEEIDTEAARNTVLRSIEAMLADPDPNTAIIGAYARLLEGMAASGVPRRVYEAPVEHLRRALTRLRVRQAPIRRLVDLFEVARFSTQTLTAEHRADALDALHDVAADLGHEPAATSGLAVSVSDGRRS